MTPRVQALILAAGRSSRTGASHKLLSTFDGVPLIRRSASTALASKATGTTIVLGWRAAEMRSALNGLTVDTVDNPRWSEGLSTSLIAGFAAVPGSTDGVLILLADQPLLAPDHLDRLIDAFSPIGRGSIVVATDSGRRFNPVLISSSYSTEIINISGDVGARKILAAHSDAIRSVEIGRAASLDVDTLESIVEAGGVPEKISPSA